MHIDVVILPPNKLSEEIGSFVTGVNKQYPLKRMVDNRRLLPHISLFHLNVHPRDLGGVVDEARRISKGFKSFKVSFTKTGGSSLVFGIGVKPTLAIYKLHRDVVESTHRFCFGTEDLPPGPKKNIHKEYIKRYGVGNILRCFWPHITLGWVKKPEDVEEIYRQTDNFDFGEFLASRLAVAQVESHHQVVKILKEFKLKK